MYRGQETHPTRVNARYEMNWARRTNRHLGEPSIAHFHLRWSRGTISTPYIITSFHTHARNIYIGIHIYTSQTLSGGITTIEVIFDNMQISVIWVVQLNNLPIFDYCLLSNIRHISNTRHTDFWEFPAWVFSNHQFTPNLQYKMHPEIWLWEWIVDKEWRKPTWSKLLRVARDFDSPRITGPMTPHQSLAYVRHITLAPTVNLFTSSAIVFVSIKARKWHDLCRYIEGIAILLTVKVPRWTTWPKISWGVMMKIMWIKTSFQWNHISLRQIVHIKLHFSSMTSEAPYFCYDFTGV